MKKKLNIGCGENWKSYPEYDGLDIKDFGQLYIDDARKFFTSVARVEFYEEIMANHFFEHFSQDDLNILFKAIWKALRVGGTLRFVVPHMNKDRAWVLSHKTFWCEETVKWLAEKEADEVYNFGKWKVVELVANEREDIHVLLEKII